MKPAALHKGRCWIVIRLPWIGFSSMQSGFADRAAAIAWAEANGLTIVNETEAA